MKFTGKLRWVDLGPGAWVLETSDGQQLPLYGEVPQHLDGRQVVVHGTKVEAFGTTMTSSAAIEVERVSGA